MKWIKILILCVYYTIPLASICFWHYLGIIFNIFLHYTLLAHVHKSQRHGALPWNTDEGSIHKRSNDREEEENEEDFY